MDRITVFLRTSLFTFGGADAHVPSGVMAITGKVLETPAGGLLIRARRFLDDRGRPIGEQELTLHVPWSKIDHVVVHED